MIGYVTIDTIELEACCHRRFLTQVISYSKYNFLVLNLAYRTVIGTIYAQNILGII